MVYHSSIFTWNEQRRTATSSGRKNQNIIRTRARLPLKPEEDNGAHRILPRLLPLLSFLLLPGLSQAHRLRPPSPQAPRRLARLPTLPPSRRRRRPAVAGARGRGPPQVRQVAAPRRVRRPVDLRHRAPEVRHRPGRSAGGHRQSHHQLSGREGKSRCFVDLGLPDLKWLCFCTFLSCLPSREGRVSSISFGFGALEGFGDEEL